MGMGRNHGKTWLVPDCKHLKTTNTWGKTQEWLEHRHSDITKQYLTEIQEPGKSSRRLTQQFTRAEFKSIRRLDEAVILIIIFV